MQDAGWSIQALLDERRQLLAAVEALAQARATVTTTLAARAMEQPAVRGAMDQATRKSQTTIDHHAERLRHRLLLDDGILSTRGHRPREQAKDSP